MDYLDWIDFHCLWFWGITGLGKECNGLYLLQDSTPHTAFVVNVGHSSLELWHSRPGHPSYSKFSLLKDVVDVAASNKANCCDICHYSKQKRLSFSSSSHV